MAKEKETSGALKVDHLSFEIGVITAFAEIVGVGVKRLALSGTMTTAEVNAVWGEATHIANENHVALHRETDCSSAIYFRPMSPGARRFY